MPKQTTRIGVEVLGVLFGSILGQGYLLYFFLDKKVPKNQG
jgi:hypothetical protein